MKKFSKILCLVLVVVMMAGLCAVGTSAAYTDADKITYTEAVDVMSALGIIDGMGDGSFAPNGTLTRAQACKLIAYMLGDGDMKAASTFKDTKGHWAEDYIAYCAAQGIVNGVGNGKFDPDGTLTGYAWAKMVLVALGYNAELTGMTGASWEIGVAKLTKTAGTGANPSLAKRIAGYDGTKAITREQAAELGFQGLFAQTKVHPTTVNMETGAEVVNKTPINDGRNLAVDIFNLAGTPGNTDNDFGAPTTTYTNTKGLKVVVADVPVATFTVFTKPADVAAALNGYFVMNGATKTAINNTNVPGAFSAALSGTGALTVGATDTVAKAISDLTKNGKLVEVYADATKVVTDIVEVTYTLATVETITAQKDRTVYTLKDATGAAITGTFIDYTDATLTDSIVFAAPVAKKDVVTVARGTNALHVYPTTTVVGDQTKVDSYGNITVAGTVYPTGTGVLTTTATYVTAPANGKNVTITLDQYGCVVKSTAAAASKDFAYVLSAYVNVTSTVDGNTYAPSVKVALADGTVANYTVATYKDTTTGATKVTKLNTVLTATNSLAGLVGNVYGYTLSDNVIVLENVGGTATAANITGVKKGITSYTIGTQTVLATAATSVVYINTVKNTAAAYTVSTIPNAMSALNTNAGGSGKVVYNPTATTNVDNAAVIFVVDTSDLAANTINEYAYVDYTKATTEGTGADTKYLYTGYKADGTTVDLYATSALTGSGLFTYAADGKTADANAVSGTQFKSAATVYVNGTMLNYSGSYYNITAETQTVQLNETVKVDNQTAIVVLKVVNNTVTNDVAAIFVVG